MYKRQLIDILFCGAVKRCGDACDANNNEGNDIFDPIYILGVLFGDGSPIPAPTGSCGDDDLDEGLGGAEYDAC